MRRDDRSERVFPEAAKCWVVVAAGEDGNGLSGEKIDESEGDSKGSQLVRGFALAAIELASRHQSR